MVLELCLPTPPQSTRHVWVLHLLAREDVKKRPQIMVCDGSIDYEQADGYFNANHSAIAVIATSMPLEKSLQQETIDQAQLASASNCNAH